MFRRLLQPLALGLASVLVVVLAIQSRRLREEVRTLRRQITLPYRGHMVPAFHATTLTGDSVTIGAPPPGARQVLFVFTTTCRFCLSTLPAWKSAFAAVQQDKPGTTVYGVSLDPVAETERYIGEHALPFPVVLLADARMVALYRASSVPLSLVLDSDGRVRYARLGEIIHSATTDSLVEAVRDTSTLPVAAERGTVN
jgi:peroxiredoxin